MFEEKVRLLKKLNAMVEGGEVLMAKRQHMAIVKEFQAIILFSKD